ncbi:MAG: phage terminase large subunit [bacterium]
MTIRKGAVGVQYKLLKAQKEFLEIPHNHQLDVALYQGGFGSGKTFSGALLGILLCNKYPGIRGLVGAQTFPIVRDTTLVNYFEHLDNFGYKKGVHYEYLKTEAKLTFKNKSEVLFRYFENDTKLKSLNLGFVEIEEMSDVPESTFKMLLGRLRQADIPRYRLFGHTNPETSKGWIFKTFVESPKPNYRFIIAPTTQNVFLPDGFVENLRKAYDPEYFRINVLGEFGDYNRGLVVKGFSRENIRQVNYIKNLPLHISCDFNVDPMCWVLAHKTQEKAFFFDEIVLENATTFEAVEEFFSRYPDHQGSIIINGDASGDNRSTNSEFTNYVIMKNRLSQLGYRDVQVKIRHFNPPVKNRIAAWNAKIRNANNEVNIYIDKKCKWLVYNLENLKYKEGTSILDLPSHFQIKSNRKLKFLGHIFDAASYLVDFYWAVRLL